MRRRRRSTEALELLQTLETGELPEMIRSLVAASLLSGLPMEEICTRTGIPAKKAEAALAGLLSSGEGVQVVREPRIFLSRESFNALKRRLLGELTAYLKENPMKRPDLNTLACVNPECHLFRRPGEANRTVTEPAEGA